MKVTQYQVKKWALGVGIPFTSMAVLIIAYLHFAGVIEVHSYTHDYPCWGTIDRPCEAFINFTAKEDINISGTSSTFTFEPNVKQANAYLLTSGKWKEINFTKTLKLKKNTNYFLKLVVLKNNPADNVFWTFNIKGDTLE